MKKFKIKKGATLKIGGLPIVLQQDVIVESGTDLIKTEFVLVEERANIEEVSEDEPLDYQQRVFDEASELAQKIDKLKPFINSEKFASVNKQEQIRMIQQLGYMISYLKILTDRMSDF